MHEVATFCWSWQGLSSSQMILSRPMSVQEPGFSPDLAMLSSGSSIWGKNQSRSTGKISCLKILSSSPSLPQQSQETCLDSCQDSFQVPRSLTRILLPVKGGEFNSHLLRLFLEARPRQKGDELLQRDLRNTDCCRG